MASSTISANEAISAIKTPILPGKSAGPIKQADFFQVSGDGIQVTYSTSGIDGKPHFTYHDSFQSKSFSGAQIETVQTEIGTLVTVLVFLTVDSGSTTFSLLVPNVNLSASNTANITTLGISTQHKFSILGVIGQTEFYTAHTMQGTASFVFF
jgi:hypothetical protein